MPAAAPLLISLPLPLLLLLLGCCVPVSDAMGELGLCELLFPGADVVAVADDLFRITTPYAMMVPGALRLTGVPAVSPPRGVPSMVVKLVVVATRYTLWQPRVGPQG